MSDLSGWTQRLRLLALLVPRVRCADLLHLPDRQVGKFEEKIDFSKLMIASVLVNFVIFNTTSTYYWILLPLMLTFGLSIIMFAFMLTAMFR